MNIIEILRQPRLGNFALFDVASAYLGIYLIAPFLSRRMKKIGYTVTRAQWLWLTLPIGLLFHLIFRVSTPFSRTILDPNGGYIAKAIIVGMVYMGVVGIRRKK